MSTRRLAGAGIGLLMGCFAVASGCGDDSQMGSTGDGGINGDSGACSTTVVVSGCNTVEQNGQTFPLGCSSIESKTINGKVVCAVSGQCATTPQGQCLDPANVRSCLQNCRPQGDAGRDGGSSPLGTTCDSNADCGGGLTCMKPTDNIAPGAGAPNGLCTVECSNTTNQNLCTKTLGGICVALTSSPTAKSFCMEPCTTGAPADPDSKCHGRKDAVCSPLDTPGSFACVPLCATDADCGGTRKCDLGTGLCADIVTPGAPIGSPCTLDSDCAGAICYPFDISPDAASSAGVCSALCRLGNLEGCHFRTTPLDAGPAVGGCLLSSSTNDIGDIGICAQLCDTVNDCSTNDPRWTCILDSDVRSSFGHAGYCWLGVRPDGGVPVDAGTDVSAPPEAGPMDASSEASAPDTGAPEASPPEASPPDTGSDVTPDGADDDGTSSDASDADAPAADGATD